ncbi:(S)-2-hydroxy-acid oxidase [Tylopilus felleus]
MTNPPLVAASGYLHRRAGNHILNVASNVLFRTMVTGTLSGMVAWLVEIYSSGTPPVLGTVDIQEIEDRAREALKDSPSAFLYVLKGAGTSGTYADRWKLVPRMLNAVGERHLEMIFTNMRNLRTTIFGVTHPAPIFVAPVGAQGLMHNDGELGTVRAAAKVGVPLIASSAASRSMEEIAEAHGPNDHRCRHDDHPHDHGIPYSPAGHGFGVQQGISDPTFMARFSLEARCSRTTKKTSATSGDSAAQQAMLLGSEWISEIASGIFRSWDELQFGILARGIEAIIVFNHGGRQVDGSIGALDALDMVMQSSKVRKAQSTGKFIVLFDSGIRTGDEAGAEQILMQTIADLHITMGLWKLVVKMN